MNPVETSIRCYRFLLVTFLILTAAYGGLTLWAHSLMPDQIPVHFDGEGVPNRWAGKDEFLWVNISLVVVFFFTFALGAILIPKIPVKWINLPNKDYWLAPERKTHSFADMRVYYLAIGVVTLLLLGIIGWSSFEVAIGRQETLRYSWACLGVYSLALTILCVLLYRRFGKPT